MCIYIYNDYTHTDTHTHIYIIYIYTICVCVCVHDYMHIIYTTRISGMKKMAALLRRTPGPNLIRERRSKLPWGSAQKADEPQRQKKSWSDWYGLVGFTKILRENPWNTLWLWDLASWDIHKLNGRYEEENHLAINGKFWAIDPHEETVGTYQGCTQLQAVESDSPVPAADFINFNEPTANTVSKILICAPNPLVCLVQRQPTPQQQLITFAIGPVLHAGGCQRCNNLQDWNALKCMDWKCVLQVMWNSPWHRSTSLDPSNT